MRRRSVPLCPEAELFDPIYDDPDIFKKFDVAAVLDRRATLVIAVGGGPLRTIITGGKRNPTGRFTSVKTLREHPWKNEAERSRMIVCEVDPDVSSFLAQPHRIDFEIGKKTVRFFPDLRIDRRDGTVAIEKIRSKTDQRRGRDFKPAIDWARDVYDALGWDLCVLDRSEIEAGRTFRNAVTIYLDKNCKTTPGDVVRAHDEIARRGGEAPYAALADAIGPPPRGQAVLHALIVGGALALDLDAILDADTPIRRLIPNLGDGRCPR